MNPDAGYWWRYSKNVCVKVKFGNIKISSRAILARQSIGQSRRQEKANDTSQHLVCCLCCSLEQGPRAMYSDGGFFTITLSLRISRRVNPWILLWRNQSPVFSILNPICSISRNIQKDDPRFLTPSPLFVQIVTTLYYVILLKHSILVIGSKTRTNQWKILVLGRECMRIWISFILVLLQRTEVWALSRSAPRPA